MSTQGAKLVLEAGRDRLVDARNPFAIDAEEYAWGRRIQWRTPHSRRLQDALGDREVVMGFDADYAYGGERPGIWVIAVLKKRYVIEHVGRREVPTEDVVPIPIGLWEDGTGRPLPPDHPALVESVRFARWKHEHGWRGLLKERAARDARWEKESRSRERAALGKELFPAFRRWADGFTGFVGREGEGGKRRHFYEGCLRP